MDLRCPPPYLCHHGGIDTSTTTLISPVLEPEIIMALTLRYALSHEEASYQYARALVRRFTADLPVHDPPPRNIITETTNDIRNFEGVASRIDVALRQVIDHVEAELAD